MSEDNMGSSIPPRPMTNDRGAWPEYWIALGQPWRLEPEIDEERQAYLTEQRLKIPDLLKGIYPFQGIKLTRADVEWLLATHEDRLGPVIWNGECQGHRKGLDLRGADLHQVNLSGLPLACILGGLDSLPQATREQYEAAAIHLEGANLRAAHLEGANLRAAHLEGADLDSAHLEGADLVKTRLEKANLYEAFLMNVYLAEAGMERATLARAHLKGANLKGAQLQEANLRAAHLEGANLAAARLEEANLSSAFFDNATQLDNISLGNEQFGTATLVDIHWGDVNIAVVNWASIKKLGDEIEADQRRTDYTIAIRANRQLAVMLKTQGLNEDASRFAYRADLLKRKMLWRQKKIGSYLFSCCLDVLAGYGFMPERSLLAYLIVIAGFTTIYYVLGQTVGPNLSLMGAFVFSMISFHGRGFFPGGIRLDAPLTLLSAIEAFVGLVIEVSLIATFTQRFFGK